MVMIYLIKLCGEIRYLLRCPVLCYCHTGHVDNTELCQILGISKFPGCSYSTTSARLRFNIIEGKNHLHTGARRTN
jgi:hypothetical protein